MSESPRVVLSAEDIEAIIDQSWHFERGGVAHGFTAHQWISHRHVEANRARAMAKQPRIDFPAFLHIFVNDLGPASRARVDGHGWDLWHLPEGVTLSPGDKVILRDNLALNMIENVLWRRSEAAKAQAAEGIALVQASVERRQREFPNGALFPAALVAVEYPAETASEETAPWPTNPTDWMLRYAAAHYGDTGQKLSRPAGVAACRDRLKCDEVASAAAYHALPDELRNTVGRQRKIKR